MSPRPARWADTSQRCPRCGLQHPPESHETKCKAWHDAMDTVGKAAAVARDLAPSFPVSAAQAIDLLAHLTTRGIPDPERIVQVVLDLGWRPFQGALMASPDSGATGDLPADLPP